MNKSVLNKLLLARSLFYLAKENTNSHNSIRLSIACNLLQDSVECFLLALSEHLNAGIGPRTDFDKYFEQVNMRIAPRELPFRARLIALNKLRVNSKHYGLEPARSEFEPLLTVTSEFFSDVSRMCFHTEFASLNPSELFRDGEIKDLIKSAEDAYESNDYEESLISCRKAIFLRFEKNYDAQQFTNGKTVGALGALGSQVPYFARDSKYLEEHVLDPTEFVILDHRSLEMTLLTSGIDSIAFWNVRRLTPDVYRQSTKDPWIVKKDFRKLDDDGIKERAEYVLTTTTEILWTHDQQLIRTRNTNHKRFHLNLKQDSVPVYVKASKNSHIEQHTPCGITQLTCDFVVNGLDGTDFYWHVSHWDDNAHVFGFIHNDDVAN